MGDPILIPFNWLLGICADAPKISIPKILPSLSVSTISRSFIFIVINIYGVGYFIVLYFHCIANYK